MVLQPPQTTRPSQKFGPSTANQILQFLRSYDYRGLRHTITFSRVGLSEYRKPVRHCENHPPTDSAYYSWVNKLRHDYDSATQDLTIHMVPGRSHEYVSKHIEANISEYIQKCQRSGGIVQAIAQKLHGTGQINFSYKTKSDPDFDPASQGASSMTASTPSAPDNDHEEPVVSESPHRVAAPSLATSPSNISSTSSLSTLSSTPSITESLLEELTVTEIPHRVATSSLADRS